MSPRTVEDALLVVEEAVELGEPPEIALAAAELAAGLERSPAGPDAGLLLAELIAAATSPSLDRAACARLIHRVRALAPPASRAGAASEDTGDDDTAAAQEPAHRWAVAADAVDVLRDFAVEARGLLDEAEQAFLVLESAGGGEGIATGFRAFHTIKGVAGFLELDVLAATAHRTESLLALVRDGALAAGPCVDVVLRGIDLVRALVDCALRGEPHDLAPIQRYYADLAAAGQPAAAPAPAPAQQAAVAWAPSAPRHDEDPGSVKVDTHKMDQLVDLVGELAIAQAQLAADPGLATLTTPSLLRSISALARVARELQRAALAMRMVAIKSTFDRMGRVARDTARALGKAISFQVEGAQTELDRTMVEAIYDPLVHLVRNAIDHGIEGASERARRDKPAAGAITLRAYHQAGHVVVEIVDDGGGLDRARILAHARSRGLVGHDDELTADEIHHLIFRPGFSTAAEVTSVSGRGVGMDVVRTNIERVRGRVEIASTPGLGTTIRLKLPLTLAIIDGLLVGVGDERYVLPASWAREIFRPRPEQRSTIQQRGEMVNVRGTLYPAQRLSALLGRGGGGDGDGVMIMVDHGARGVCLQVDRLLGKQEVVVKGLGSMFAGVGGVAGAAILGDGKVALILDIPTLLGPPSGGERQVA